MGKEPKEWLLSQPDSIVLRVSKTEYPSQVFSITIMWRILLRCDSVYLPPQCFCNMAAIAA